MKTKIEGINLSMNTFIKYINSNEFNLKFNVEGT